MWRGAMNPRDRWRCGSSGIVLVYSALLRWSMWACVRLGCVVRTRPVAVCLSSGGGGESWACVIHSEPALRDPVSFNFRALSCAGGENLGKPNYCTVWYSSYHLSLRTCRTQVGCEDHICISFFTLKDHTKSNTPSELKKKNQSRTTRG